MADLEFRCRTCGETHVGLPAWHFEAPAQVLAMTAAEREARVDLTADQCVIEDERAPGGWWLFARGLLEIPVHGTDVPVTWGVWLSLGAQSFERHGELLEQVDRQAGESFFGWLCSAVPGYPDTLLLKARLHVRAYPCRPWVELEPTAHPLAVAQREGITREDAIEMATRLLHPAMPAAPAEETAAG